MNVKCPRCGKTAGWEENRWKPFCSERCKLIDLGSWIQEEYGIAEELVSEDNIKQLDGVDKEK